MEKPSGRTREFEYVSFVAFDELDMQGILHHSRHLLHVERACHAFFQSVMGAEGFRPDLFPDLNAVVRRLNIEYVRPLAGVVPITVALCVTRLRSCTMTTAFELRSADGTAVYSRGEREICRVKPDELRPELWSDGYVARFGEWALGSAIATQ